MQRVFRKMKSSRWYHSCRNMEIYEVHHLSRLWPNNGSRSAATRSVVRCIALFLGEATASGPCSRTTRSARPKARSEGQVLAQYATGRKLAIFVLGTPGRRSKSPPSPNPKNKVLSNTSIPYHTIPVCKSQQYALPKQAPTDIMPMPQVGHPARRTLMPSHHSSPPASGATPFTYRPYHARYRSKRSFWKEGLRMPWCSPG